MGMVVQKRPCVAGRTGLGQQGGKPIQHVLAVVIVTKDLAALDAPNHYMLQNPRRIQSRGSWHDHTTININRRIQVTMVIYPGFPC